jgi:Fe2+ or Zn2+ uptake regulation protein
MKFIDKIDHVRSIICRLQEVSGKQGRAVFTSYEIAKWSKLSHSTVYRTLKMLVVFGDISEFKTLHRGQICTFYSMDEAQLKLFYHGERFYADY